MRALAPFLFMIGGLQPARALERIHLATGSSLLVESAEQDDRDPSRFVVSYQSAVLPDRTRAQAEAQAVFDYYLATAERGSATRVLLIIAGPGPVWVQPPSHHPGQGGRRLPATEYYVCIFERWGSKWVQSRPCFP
jgi:hypothetical protein